MNDETLAASLVNAILTQAPVKEWKEVQAIEKKPVKQPTYRLEEGQMYKAYDEMGIPEHWLRQMALINEPITLQDSDGRQIDKFIKSFRLRPFLGEGKYAHRIVFWLPEIERMKAFMSMIQVETYSIVELFEGRIIFEKTKGKK